MKDIYEGLARRTEGLLSDVRRAGTSSPQDDRIDRILQYGKEIGPYATPHGFEAPIRFNPFQGEWTPYERPAQVDPKRQSTGVPFNQPQQGFVPSFGSMIPGYKQPIGKEGSLAPTQQHTGAPYKPQSQMIPSFGSMTPGYRPPDNTIPSEHYKMEGSLSDMNKNFFQGDANIPTQPTQEPFQGLASHDRWEGLGPLLSRTFGQSPEGDPSLIAQAAYNALDAVNEFTSGLWKGTSVMPPLEGESKFKMKESEGLGSYLTRFFGTSPEGEPSLLSQDINQLLDAIENTSISDLWKGVTKKPEPFVVDTTGMSKWEKRGVKTGEVTKEVGKFVEDVYMTQALATLGVPTSIGFGATRASRSFWEERDLKEAGIVGAESAIFSAVLGLGTSQIKKLGFRYLEKLPPVYRDSLALDFTTRLLAPVVASPFATTASSQVREPLSIPEAEAIIHGAAMSFIMGLYPAAMETARFHASPADIQKLNKYQGELLANQARIENNKNMPVDQKRELLNKISRDRLEVLNTLESIYKADRIQGLPNVDRLDNLEKVRTIKFISEMLKKYGGLQYVDELDLLLGKSNIEELHAMRKILSQKGITDKDIDDVAKNYLYEKTFNTGWPQSNAGRTAPGPQGLTQPQPQSQPDTRRLSQVVRDINTSSLPATTNITNQFAAQAGNPNLPRFQSPTFTPGTGTNLPDYFRSLIPQGTQQGAQVPATTEPQFTPPTRPLDIDNLPTVLGEAINNPNLTQGDTDVLVADLSKFLMNLGGDKYDLPKEFSGTLPEQIDQLSTELYHQADIALSNNSILKKSDPNYQSDGLQHIEAMAQASRMRYTAGLESFNSSNMPSANPKLREQLISSGKFVQTPEGLTVLSRPDRIPRETTPTSQISRDAMGIAKAIGDNKGIVSRGIARDKSALRDRVVGLARAGNVPAVRQALGDIRQAQSSLPAPMFGDRSTIWQLEKVARDVDAKRGSDKPVRTADTRPTKETKPTQISTDSTKPTTKVETKTDKPTTKVETKTTKPTTKVETKPTSTDSTKDTKVARLSTDSKNKVHRIRPQSAVDPVFEKDLKKYGYKYNESTKAWEAPITEGSAKDLKKLTNKHIKRFVDAKSIDKASQLPDTTEGLNEYIKQYAQLEKKGFIMDLQLFAAATRKLSKLAGTVKDLSYMKDPFTQALIFDAELNYKTKTNEASMERALIDLENDYYGEYNRLMTEGIKTAEDSVAAGIILRDLKELAYETGDFDKMTSFLKKAQSDYTDMGQALQAIITWSDDTVEGSLLRAEKITQKIVTEDKKEKPGKHKRKDEDIKASKKEIKESKKEFSREIQKSVDKLIREGLTFPSGKVPSPSNKESMVKWINDWYETGRFKRKDFIDKIVEEQKLSVEDATKLNDELYSKLKDITKRTKDRLLERAMKDKPQKEEKKRATEKLTRLVNQGLLENKKFEDKVLDKLSPIIKEVMRDNKINIQEVVKLSLSEQLAAKRKALKDVFNNVRVDDTEINTLVNTISSEFDKIAKSKKESMLLAMAAETKPPKPAKTPLEKLEQKMNLGLYDEGIDTAVQNAILDKYNLPHLSSEDVKYINDRFKELEKLPKDSWAYRAIQSQIKNVVADKMPTNIVTKMAAIQRINLLGNAKTFSRNFTSIFHGGLEAVTQDTIGVAIDRAVSKARNSPRTRYFDPVNKLKDFKKDWISSFKDTMRDVKYGTETRRFESSDYVQPSNPFSNENIIGSALNKVGKVIGKGQEAGDRPFQEAEYNIKVKELMKAHGVTEPTKEIKEKAIEHTIDRFLYRNAALYRASRKTKEMFDHTAWKMFTQLLMPFTKFAGNAVERTLDYQGLGFIKAAGHATKVATGRAEFNQKYFVDSLTRGATGLGLLAAGAGLAAAGILNIESSDKKIRDFQKEQGILGNSFKIGNRYYRLDFIGPFMPAIMLGAVIHDSFKGEDPDLVSSILDGFSNQLDILYKQPSLELARKMTRYNKTFVEAVTETIIDHVASQSIPTPVKQLASWIDDKERQYWDSDLFRRTMDRYMYSLPILRQELAPKYGVLGSPIESYGNNFFEAFINPSINGEYVKGENAVADEILSLINEGHTIQIPTLPSKKITRTHPETKERFEWDLDHEEYADLAYLQGAYSQQFFGNLMQLPIYIDAPSEYRALMLQEILKEVRTASVQQFLVEKGYMTEKGYISKLNK